MRDWLADFIKLDFETLERSHKFYVILPVPLWSLQRIIDELKISAHAASLILCDPDSTSFKALNFNVKFDTRSKFSSIHAKTSVFQATVRGFSIGIRTGMQGNPSQQGGAFVIDIDSESKVGYKCRWCHYDRHNSDQVEIPVLLKAAGATI
jgi:hypothetical protein